MPLPSSSADSWVRVNAKTRSKNSSRVLTRSGAAGGNLARGRRAGAGRGWFAGHEKGWQAVLPRSRRCRCGTSRRASRSAPRPGTPLSGPRPRPGRCRPRRAPGRRPTRGDPRRRPWCLRAGRTPRDRPGRGHPGDLVAQGRLARVALGRDDHGDRRARRPVGPGHAAQRLGGGRGQQPAQRGGQPVQHDLGLRVAEPGVELHHPYPGGGQAQPRVQQAAVRDAAAAQLMNGGLDDRGQHLVGQAGWRPGQRDVRAHTAGVRSQVPVLGPLEVLRGQQRDRGEPVGQREQRHLRAVQELLDDHRAARLRVGPGGSQVGGDEHALARGQAVRLHHVRRPELGQRRVRLVAVLARVRHGGGDPGRLHDLLGERLGALDGRGPAAGTEARDAGRAQRVGHPGYQRRLRADHDQVGAGRPGQARHLPGVRRVHRVLVGELGDARVAWRRMQVGDVRVGGQGPGQRVLAAARTEEKDSHGREPTCGHTRARGGIALARALGETASMDVDVAVPQNSDAGEFVAAVQASRSLH